MMTADDLLAQRVHNCLQTILELEEVLDNSFLGSQLQDEFTTLKRLIRHVGDIPLNEDEVGRIEKATDRFLQELQNSQIVREGLTNNSRRILH